MKVWSPEEDQIILEMYQGPGTKWSRIVEHIPGPADASRRPRAQPVAKNLHTHTQCRGRLDRALWQTLVFPVKSTNQAIYSWSYECVYQSYQYARPKLRSMSCVADESWSRAPKSMVRCKPCKHAQLARGTCVCNGTGWWQNMNAWCLDAQSRSTFK